jgi:hypothetical protein
MVLAEERQGDGWAVGLGRIAARTGRATRWCPAAGGAHRVRGGQASGQGGTSQCGGRRWRQEQSGYAGCMRSRRRARGPGCWSTGSGREAGQGQGGARCVVQERRAVGRAAQVVRPRPGPLRGIRPPLPAGAASSPAGRSTGAPARSCEGPAVDAAHRDQATRDQPGGRARRPAPQLSRAAPSAPPRCRLPEGRPRPRGAPAGHGPPVRFRGGVHPPPPTTPWSASSRAAPLSSRRSPVGVRKRRPVCGDSPSTISSRSGNSTPSSSSCSVLATSLSPAIGRSWCRAVRTMSARVRAAAGPLWRPRRCAARGSGPPAAD